MHHYALLRLLLAFFFLYIAWPYIPEASSQLENIFWGAWLVFFCFIVAANVSTLLHISEPPKLEANEEKLQKVKRKMN